MSLAAALEDYIRQCTTHEYAGDSESGQLLFVSFSKHARPDRQLAPHTGIVRPGKETLMVF